ncbi:MAG: hypothetical protein NXI04_13740 [Planctomycetaceae bacterium]|nr:hypothetical protein [Planctomycetaceae bacterium]
MVSIHLLLMLLVQAPEDETPTGPEVVARYVKAKGGEQRLRETTSYRLQLEIRVDGEKTTDSEILQTKGRHRTTHTLPDGSQLAHGTDGRTVWYTGPDLRSRQLDGEEKAEYLRHHSTLHESLEWKDHFPVIECKGRAEVDGRAAWEVHFTPEKGRPVRRYFDVESRLFVREIVTAADGTEAISTISDYRPIAGVLVPFKRVTSIRNHRTEYIIRQAEKNVDVPDSAFAAPKPREGQKSKP